MHESPVFHAWVDESIHSAQPPDTDGMYVLAATIADQRAADIARHVLLGLRAGTAGKLHWREEGHRRRRVISRELAQVDVAHCVIVGTPTDPRKQERARRLCLERLVHALCGHAVAHLWVESRTQSLNRRDIAMVDALRTRRVMPATMAFDFALPSEEPMLWFPDIIAGSTGLHLRGLDGEPFSSLASRITVHRLTLR